MAENKELSIKVHFDSKRFIEDIKVAYTEEITNGTFKITDEDLKGMNLIEYITLG